MSFGRESRLPALQNLKDFVVCPFEVRLEINLNICPLHAIEGPMGCVKVTYFCTSYFL